MFGYLTGTQAQPQTVGLGMEYTHHLREHLAAFGRGSVGMELDRGASPTLEYEALGGLRWSW